MSQPRLVVVEDDPDLLEVLRESLSREGYQVLTANNGVDGLSLIKQTRPDLVCLDIMMPEMDGIEVCRELRADKEFGSMPILMLTAKGEESDVVLGLGVGADDYVVKPARPKELVARVRALLRRRQSDDSGGHAPLLAIGPLEIDEERFEVRISGEALPFTPTEFHILQALAKKPGRAFKRSELLEQVGGVFVEERTVDAHVKSIRSKLGEHASLIQTIRGRGYSLREPGQ